VCFFASLAIVRDDGAGFASAFAGGLDLPLFQPSKPGKGKGEVEKKP